MQRQLGRLVREFEETHERLHRLADRLSPERANNRNDATRWSVAECVAHLNLTSMAFIPILESAL